MSWYFLSHTLYLKTRFSPTHTHTRSNLSRTVWPCLFAFLGLFETCKGFFKLLNGLNKRNQIYSFDLHMNIPPTRCSRAQVIVLHSGWWKDNFWSALRSSSSRKQSSAMSHTRMDNGPLRYLSQDTRAWVCCFLISDCILFAGKKKKLNLYSCPDSKLTLSATWISFFQIWGILSPSLCALRMMMLNFFFASGSSSPPQSTFFHMCQILIHTISCATFISL